MVLRMLGNSDSVSRMETSDDDVVIGNAVQDLFVCLFAPLRHTSASARDCTFRCIRLS